MNAHFPHLFCPLTLGQHTLKNRAVLTPHAHVVSSLWASEQEAQGHIAYWKARTEAAWIDGVSAHVRNRFPRGFDPTGVGAQSDGHFRQPFFHDRVSELAETVHADNTILTVQMILQGGMPHGPSARLSGPTEHHIPHPMTLGDIDYFVDEYAYSALQAVQAGADGVEIHLNHDDMLEWFVSPLTNHRRDEFGGSQSKRLEFPRRILTAIRDAIGKDRLLGIRFTMFEDEPGGYDLGEGAEIITELVANTQLDWVSLTAGSPWGSPSYVQAQQHEPAEWAPLSAKIRAATQLPLVYTGRVNSPEVAEAVLSAGHADIVGFARAVIADPELLTKAKEGRSETVRPCVGGNECISRRLIENTQFSCAVNPFAGREHLPVPQAPQERKKVLVVGAGPAGLELAATLSERGHQVDLWEAQDRVGGQLHTAIQAPGHEDYRRYLDWQAARVRNSTVAVHTGKRATAESIIAHNADTVFLTTGASPRIPEDIEGVTLPGVYTSVDMLDGRVTVPRGRILVIAQDDHLPPLAAAQYLAQNGEREVTIVYPTSAPAPSMSRYSRGSALGQVYELGVQILIDTDITRIAAEDSQLAVTCRNVYSRNSAKIGNFDAVVLSCGAIPQTELFDELQHRHHDVRVLGDAWAPRRLVWATRQAYEAAVSV